MGFNYYNYGNIQPCRVEGGNLIYRLPSGKEIVKKTQLKVDIHEQCNLFISDTVSFLLFEGGLMYVGRADGSISIYRESDELLVGLNNWEKDQFPETQLCGFYKENGGLSEIHVDCRDWQTLYICGEYMQSYSRHELPHEFNLDKAVFDARIFGCGGSYHLFDSKGVRLRGFIWTVQDDVRQRNCRIFV